MLASIALALFLAAGFAAAEEKEAKKDPVTHLDAEKAGKLLAEDDEARKPVILDVRTPDEFAEGHLEGAKNIDFNAKDFAERLGKLDKEKPYLVHCRSGGRSGRSLATFEKLGFKKLYHLDGGILAWEDAGLPVVK
jgi:rhodanese-related sulfurtransferase